MVTKTLITAIMLAATASAMKFSKWETKQCTGMNIDGGYLTPREGCQKRGKEIAIAVDTIEDDEADMSRFAVFFKSDDCDPKTIINQTDGGCSSRVGVPQDFGSWEIWDMCDGKVGCEL